MGLTDLAMNANKELYKKLRQKTYDGVEQALNKGSPMRVSVDVYSSAEARYILNNILPDMATELGQGGIYIHVSKYTVMYAEGNSTTPNFFIFDMNVDPVDSIQPSGKKFTLDPQ